MVEEKGVSLKDVKNCHEVEATFVSDMEEVKDVKRMDVKNQPRVE
jgi:hypothetical protein